MYCIILLNVKFVLLIVLVYIFYFVKWMLIIIWVIFDLLIDYVCIYLNWKCFLCMYLFESKMFFFMFVFILMLNDFFCLLSGKEMWIDLCDI